MCGIAGYSVSPASSAPRTLAAQALLAGIAERGADAVGYAHRGSAAEITSHKQRSGATALLDELHIPDDATQALVHVRDYTKGHPRIEANNHPIRHGGVVGIHNGIIVNDEEIFARYGFERAEPDMSVDSEAIFALAEHAEGNADALEELRGAMATAWFDDRLPSTLFLAAAVGRPLWVGTGRTRALLRLDPRRARSARAHATAQPPQARARRGHAAARRGRPRCRRPSASSPTTRTSRRRSSPPCGLRTRAAAACSASPRSQPPLQPGRIRRIRPAAIRGSGSPPARKSLKLCSAARGRSPALNARRRRRLRRPCPRRGAAPGRGTGTPPRRAARRSSGRPATR